MKNFEVTYEVVSQFKMVVQAEDRHLIVKTHPSFQNPLPLGWESGGDIDQWVNVIEVVETTKEDYDWDFSNRAQAAIDALEALEVVSQFKKHCESKRYNAKLKSIQDALGVLLHDTGREI